jgi:hypothetical protein
MGAIYNIIGKEEHLSLAITAPPDLYRGIDREELKKMIEAAGKYKGPGKKKEGGRMKVTAIVSELGEYGPRGSARSVLIPESEDPA